MERDSPRMRAGAVFRQMQGQQAVAKLAGEEVLADVPGDVNQAATTGRNGDFVKSLAHTSS
jgi:hypothetical protein